MNSDQSVPPRHADSREHTGAGSSSPGAEPGPPPHAPDHADDAEQEQATGQPVEPLEGYERL